MNKDQQGISNRETANEEHLERQEFARPESVTRDAAGHVHEDSPTNERERREEDERQSGDDRAGEP